MRCVINMTSLFKNVRTLYGTVLAGRGYITLPKRMRDLKRHVNYLICFVRTDSMYNHLTYYIRLHTTKDILTCYNKKIKKHPT